MRYHRTPLMMLAACSLLLPASLATAQQSPAGVVQLGHRTTSGCLSADGCDGCSSGYGKGKGSLFGGAFGHGANANGSCRHYAAAGRNGGRYGYGCNPHYSQCWLGKCLNAHSPYHRCTHPPDHGFAPPAHRPIRPTPALYTNMFAGQSGAGAVADPSFRHPMVYMPTDTTQLGYYYQQVPYWKPRAGMIPPVPQPDEWHTPDTGVVFTGFQDAGYSSAMQGCPYGEVIDQGVVDEGVPVQSEPIESSPAQSTPGPSSSVPMMESNPPYSPEPVRPQMVPPAVESTPHTPSGPKASGPSALRAPAGQDLEKSASLPLLIPVPPQ